MRVLLTSHGSTGDIYPMIRLGKALLAAGHEVKYATVTLFQQEIESAGMEYVYAARLGGGWVRRGDARLSTGQAWAGSYALYLHGVAAFYRRNFRVLGGSDALGGLNGLVLCFCPAPRYCGSLRCAVCNPDVFASFYS